MEFSVTEITRADFATVSAANFAHVYLPRQLKETIYYDNLETRLRQYPAYEFSPFRDFRTYFNRVHADTYSRLVYLNHLSISLITERVLALFQIPPCYVTLEFHPLRLNAVNWRTGRSFYSEPRGSDPLPAMWGGSSTTTPPETENPTLFDLLEDDAHDSAQR